MILVKIWNSIFGKLVSGPVYFSRAEISQSVLNLQWGLSTSDGLDWRGHAATPCRRHTVVARGLYGHIGHMECRPSAADALTELISYIILFWYYYYNV